jgi:predicted Ser/Thr protein kinase
VAALEPEDPRFVGDYQILGRLGAGGMGRVFLGRSPGGRQVAVKVVHAELVREQEFRSRFRREVQAARMVSGAFTAPVIDADPDATQPWLVTSYIAGPSLQQAVDDGGPVPSATALVLAAGLAEALKSIHGAGLVHRDLKPSNVLLAEDGPRVIDFGIARTLEADTLAKAGLMLGSPGFMAPEQVNADEITAAADVFALGAVLAYAATGSHPFGQGTPASLLYRVVHAEPDIEAVTDPGLRALVADCLAKDPGVRPTPREILARVGFGTGGGPIALMEGPGWLPAAHRAHTSGMHGDAWDGARGDVRDGMRGDARDDGRGDGRGHSRGATLALAEPVPRDAPARRYPQVDTAPPQAPGRPHRTGRTRRTLLLSGLATVAAAGVTTGFLRTRPAAHRIATGRDATGRNAAAASPSPSSAPPAPIPVGHWPLDESSGSVVADATGSQNGTATGVQWRAGNRGAAEFDGASSRITTQTQVLDTGPGHSFTVAAWVWLSGSPGHFATAVSQGATAYSSFYLQFSSDDDRWAFSVPGARALSGAAPAMRTWTHLAGVCDASGSRLRLYVDGTRQGTASDSQPVTSTGSLFIGCATSNGQPVDFFPGAIKDVQVFDRALSPAQIKALR